MPGVPRTTWANVAAAPPINWPAVSSRTHYQCCSLPAGHDMIDFAKDCAWHSYITLPHNGTSVLAWRGT